MTVLIAGGGPSGSYLASILASNGINVVLVESLDNPYTKVFSSAVLPIDSIYYNTIPYTSISTYWDTWQIIGPKNKHYSWRSKKNLGIVLDFGKFRECLWNRAKDLGAKIYLGWKVKRVSAFEEFADVEICSNTGEILNLKVNLVVDATGYKRSILGLNIDSNDQLYTGNGIEWLLQGDKNSYYPWQKSISFFLGSSWVKYGYGWIFPMDNYRLKVGICRLPPKEGKQNTSNINDIQSLINRNNLESLKILDKHGGLISSTLKRTETHYKKRIVGVGDSISTANLLGGEGIRHALNSSRVLGELLIETLNKNSFNTTNELLALKAYKKKLKKELGWRWNISNKIGSRFWPNLSNKKSDLKLDMLIKSLSKSSKPEDISSILFEYKFGRYVLRLLPYLIGVK